ncbi:hypothetical protein KCV07_g546, partial [Aureobasidium melanogenum]
LILILPILNSHLTSNNSHGISNLDQTILTQVLTLPHDLQPLIEHELTHPFQIPDLRRTKATSKAKVAQDGAPDQMLSASIACGKDRVDNTIQLLNADLQLLLDFHRQCLIIDGLIQQLDGLTLVERQIITLLTLGNRVAPESTNDDILIQIGLEIFKTSEKTTKTQQILEYEVGEVVWLPGMLVNLYGEKGSDCAISVFEGEIVVTLVIWTRCLFKSSECKCCMHQQGKTAKEAVELEEKRVDQALLNKRCDRIVAEVFAPSADGGWAGMMMVLILMELETTIAIIVYPLANR